MMINQESKLLTEYFHLQVLQFALQEHLGSCILPSKFREAWGCQALGGKATTGGADWEP